MSRPWLTLPALRAGLLLTAAGGFAAPALAEPVDVELILAVDVSLSMSPEELAIQRDGYAAALTHEQVIRAIEDGMHGKIALAYVEWAGDSVQHVIVPWTIIANGEDARRVAERLTVAPSNSARRTSISGVLDFAADLFAESAIAACGAWSTSRATGRTTRGRRWPGRGTRLSRRGSRSTGCR